jgi:hypothetical protein
MVPAAYVKLQRWPLTPNGKLDRKALPEPSELDLPRAGYVAPATATEAALCDIWKDLLGVARVGATENFFQLGGHSILVIRMLAALNTSFGLSLTARAVFDKATPANLGAHIDVLLALSRREVATQGMGEEEYMEGEL